MHDVQAERKLVKILTSQLYSEIDCEFLSENGFYDFFKELFLGHVGLKLDFCFSKKICEYFCVWGELGESF